MNAVDATVARQWPSSWDSARLRDIFDIQQGVAMSPMRREASPRLPFLRTLNVVWGGVDLSVLDEMYFTDQEVARLALRDGDLLICEGGDVGRTGIWKGELPTCLHQNHIHRLRAKTGDVEPDFCMYWMQAAMKLRLYAGQWGETTIANLSSSQLGLFEVPLPPPAEQRRIVAALRERLDAVAQARAAAAAQLEAGRALRAALLRAVFESDEAKEWPRVVVGEIASVSGGIQKSPGRAPRSFHRPFLTVRNVQRGWLDLSHVEHFEVSPAEAARCRLEYGDLLIVEGNGSPDQIGRNAIFGGEVEDCIHQNHVIRVRLDRALAEPEFEGRFLNSSAGALQMMEKARTTSGLYTLSVSKVQALQVPLPPLERQQDLVSRLTEDAGLADCVLTTAESQLAAIDSLPRPSSAAPSRGGL